MYCPNCGAESVQGLRYCKQCGANLNLTTEMMPPARFPMALTIIFLMLIALISIIGGVGAFALASDMSMHNQPPSNVLAIMILGPLVTLGVDVLLVWLLLRLVKIYHQPAAPQPLPQAVPRAFTPPQLDAPPSSVGSVTEHTTRNFEAHEKQIRARQASRDTNEV
ncbi:MAG TPA: zinc ribbon domain-containing protein [Blastocatellia bacterium]|nr:zinc ribbon domain-containing protein [Blastocatellia bacterium]